MKSQIGAVNPTQERQTLTAIGVAIGQAVMAHATAWATTLSMCAFILFVIYGGVGQ
jgi:hypothetical protein